ncbi:pyridoxal phosphate-dependent class II aminotransferase, partial [Candidatus Bipolaricaulota bacterium]|nr:pyridoxal phosphate-dependent class II aminotransferase [Candidatus Bipolaricaulota bacterium]
MEEKNYLKEISSPRHGGRVEEVAEARGIEPESLLDFSANMNPLAPPSGLKDHLVESLGQLEIYPDDRYGEFRNSVVDFLRNEVGTRISPEKVVPGNGSVEIFDLFLRAIVAGGGHRVIVPHPTFSEYASRAGLAGLEVERARYEDVLIYDDKLEHHDAAFLCNPNNPTGVLREKGKLREFAVRCSERGVSLLVDEAFIELAQPGESLVELALDFPNLVVARSLTKAFGVPGLRIGYGIGSGDLIDGMEKLRPPWNLNYLAARAGSKFLEYERELLEESRDYITDERDWMARKLRNLGFSLYPGSANFLLFRAEGVGLKAAELVDRCLDHNVLLRNADSFYGLDEWHVRVAVKKREENKELVGALEK